MGACSEISKKQKGSENINQSNNILEQNIKDKSKADNLQKKTFTMTSK